MHQKHILLCYKNFSRDTAVSHIGLGVTAAYTAKTLCQHGYHAEALPIHGTDDLTQFILGQEKTSQPVTHVVLMAQFLTTRNLALMVRRFPRIIFALNCHSNVGFLQAESKAIDLLREAIDLETSLPNFNVSSNNRRLCSIFKDMYGRDITYLPNLYYLTGTEPIHRPLWNGGTLRIGIFGSLRVFKNFSTCVAAAVAMINELSCHGEIWMNSGRSDGGGDAVSKVAKSWTKNLPHVTLKELHWTSWPEFKRVTGSMNILLQNSYTETFNNVTADGICEGVPSVVSDAIEWCPKAWMAAVDDPSEVAAIGRLLLRDHRAPRDGYRALKNYVHAGIIEWQRFLK